MLTVVEGLDASGASNMRSPLGKRYSVMPSREVIKVTPAGKGAALTEKGSNAHSSKVLNARQSFGKDEGIENNPYGKYASK